MAALPSETPLFGVFVYLLESLVISMGAWTNDIAAKSADPTSMSLNQYVTKALLVI